MLGVKSFRIAAVVISGIELAEKIKKQQFKNGKSRRPCRKSGGRHWLHNRNYSESTTQTSIDFGSIQVCTRARTAALAATTAIPGMCCSYSVSVPTIAAGGRVVPVSVGTQPGCSWQVTHTAGWMSNYGGQTGTGPGVVYVYVAPDYGSARSSPVHVLVNSGCNGLGGRSCGGGGSTITATTTPVQY